MMLWRSESSAANIQRNQSTSFSCSKVNASSVNIQLTFSFNACFFRPNTAPPFCHLSLKFADCSIGVAVPTLWNKLPPALREISDPSCELTKTSPLAISPQLFHSKLKALLFNKSYPDLFSSPTSLAVSTPNTIHHSRLTVCLPA